MTRLCLFACYVFPVVLGIAIWLPILRAYHLPELEISKAAVEQARALPEDSVLDQVKDFRLLGESQQGNELLASASMLLKGKMKTQNCDSRIELRFSTSDLDRLQGDCALFWAGFYVPDVLLQAYEVSGRSEFLLAAQDFILGAAEYEQTAWMPRAMFWNDHALAARMVVLGNFWRLYRHSPGYNQAVALAVLELAARTEQRLAKPGQFTFATNHGVMQNLGLWHGALCFPTLPGSDALPRLAQQRLNDQMGFYVSSEGWVLEHSSEYQGFGIGLLARAFRYLALLGQPLPAEWMVKYRRALEVYAELRRPDGSLPVFGDTDDPQDAPLVASFASDGQAQDVREGVRWPAPAGTALYPVSGYSVWWDGLASWPLIMSQTAFTWSNFSGHGHKHADELSLALWAGGQNWISNVGYWPYETAERDAAVSWDGSNAPHLRDEPFDSRRSSHLLAEASSQTLRAIDLERSTGQDSLLRREVIEYGPDTWVIVDSASGSQPTRTVWTSGNDVNWQAGKTAGSYRLQAHGSGQYLDFALISGGRSTQRLLRGSLQPFAGWQVRSSAPVPAFALVVEQPANIGSATVWSWHGRAISTSTSTETAMPQFSFTSASQWTVQLPDGIRLARQANRISAMSEAKPETVVDLSEAPSVDSERAQLRAAYERTAGRYPVAPSDTRRRRKATYLLGAALIAQQLAFMAGKAFRCARVDVLCCLAAAAWLVGGVWLVGFRL